LHRTAEPFIRGFRPDVPGGQGKKMTDKQLFDDWPDRYDRWFETPVGKAVFKYENDLISELLQPGPGERILDAGCGTGIFTREFIARKARVVGLDISVPMLAYAVQKAGGVFPGMTSPGNGHRQEDVGGSIPARPFEAVAADMTALPFADGAFDKTVSVAALEFIADEKKAVTELFRVTRPGGVVVAATLNSLSPWAVRRSAQARRDPESIFNRVFFRSPAQLLAAAAWPGMVRTAIHFAREDDPASFDGTERAGAGRETGAFVAARWQKR
jgi:ubiquinone/menaquinone biosynthesis C-methylase UbiE